jgi:hypothetical protein
LRYSIPQNTPFSSDPISYQLFIHIPADDSDSLPNPIFGTDFFSQDRGTLAQSGVGDGLRNRKGQAFRGQLGAWDRAGATPQGFYPVGPQALVSADGDENGLYVPQYLKGFFSNPEKAHLQKF